MLNEISKVIISTPSLHQEDKIEMVLDIADAGIGFVFGDKTLNDAGLQVMNAGFRAIDKTIDRTFDGAERAIGSVLDTIGSFKLW